ncbi:MAG: MGMT family protein [Clostridiaceae bacterium]|nr:MGMT family protein [Clostridiaceae bacterium]
MNFFEKVYETVKQIPHGKVTTYGRIAAICGSPRSSRQVGWALHVNPNPAEIPCHRVVNRFGCLSDSFAFGGKDAHKGLLNAEGIYVDDDYKVDLNIYLWQL